MPGFNGSGTFVRTYNWTQDAANAIPIMASRMDTEDTGFAAGLSNCIAKDGQTTVTANIPMAGFKLTGLGNASAGTDALNQTTGDGRYALLSTSTVIYKAYKTTTTSRSSNTAFADDPHLVLALPAGTFYVDVWIPFWCTSSAVGGGKFQIAFSGTTTQSGFGAVGEIAGAVTQTSVNVLSTPFNAGTPTVGTGTSADWLKFSGALVVTVAGNLSLQFAQLVSNANALNVGFGGSMIVTRIA